MQCFLFISFHFQLKFKLLKRPHSKVCFGLIHIISCLLTCSHDLKQTVDCQQCSLWRAETFSYYFSFKSYVCRNTRNLYYRIPGKKGYYPAFGLTNAFKTHSITKVNDCDYANQVNARTMSVLVSQDSWRGGDIQTQTDLYTRARMLSMVATSGWSWPEVFSRSSRACLQSGTATS